MSLSLKSSAVGCGNEFIKPAFLVSENVVALHSCHECGIRTCHEAFSFTAIMHYKPIIVFQICPLYEADPPRFCQQ